MYQLSSIYRDISLTTIYDVANPRYIGKRRNEVPPHLFAASDGAYAQMMNNTKDQVKYQADHHFYCYISSR